VCVCERRGRKNASKRAINLHLPFTFTPNKTGDSQECSIESTAAGCDNTTECGVRWEVEKEFIKIERYLQSNRVRDDKFTSKFVIFTVAVGCGEIYGAAMENRTKSQLPIAFDSTVKRETWQTSKEPKASTFGLLETSTFL
jgi:hypothetical protein